ncbi:histidine kinase [Clostridium beijerinckii]|nr:histidine kinase [Clostridium beijerinckii]
MALLAIDIINSMIQAMIFSYSVESCISGKSKVNKLKLTLMTITFLVINSSFTSIWGNLSVCVFIIHIACLVLIIILYKKDRFRALTPYTLIYCFILINAIIFNNLFFGVIKELVSVDYEYIAQILTIYIPQILLAYLCIRYIDKFIQLYKLMVSEKINMIVLIITSFCLDFIVAFYLIIYNDESKLLKNIIITILCIFLIFIIKYFAKIKQKSKQIFEMNEALEIKNNELSKIKHDYGAQISYLYGLCLMERFDDLKKSLKDIINNNDSIPTAVEVGENKQSLLSLALKPAIDKGIHVIIEEKCDFNLIKMDEMEYYRVISNIVNNAIKAMNGKGIIIAKSYEYLGNVVIKIENNGPKIEEDHLKDIFKVGFTTKDNTDNSHGYGLSIVKDLIESNNGKIYVKSTDIATEFKIVLPIN